MVLDVCFAVERMAKNNASFCTQAVRCCITIKNKNGEAVGVGEVVEVGVVTGWTVAGVFVAIEQGLGANGKAGRMIGGVLLEAVTGNDIFVDVGVVFFVNASRS